MKTMIRIRGGYLADIRDKGKPCTVEGIKRQIEHNAQEQFMNRTVPELFFFELGLEYIGTNTITFEVRE